MATGKRFYWLKLKRDFFKRHDIRIIESLPYGQKYLLFYVKLLCMSTSDKFFPDKNLREIARLTNETVGFVNEAIVFLKQYGFIKETEYGSLYVPYITNETVFSCAEKEGRDRNSTDYKLWRVSVYERDNYTCQECGERGGKLNAHHIKSWKKHPNLRFSVRNGITLCECCHKKKHKNGRIE